MKLPFKVGDKVEVNDMKGTFTVFSISIINRHDVDIILEQNNVRYFVRRRKYQIQKYNPTKAWIW